MIPVNKWFGHFCDGEELPRNALQEWLESGDLLSIEFLLNTRRSSLRAEDVRRMVEWAYKQSNISLFELLLDHGIIPSESEVPFISYHSFALAEWFALKRRGQDEQRYPRVTAKSLSWSEDEWGPWANAPCASGSPRARLYEKMVERVKRYILTSISLNDMMYRGFDDLCEDPEAREECEQTILHLVVRHKITHLVQALVEHGFPIDVPSGEYSNTPLLDAIQSNEIQIAKILIGGCGSLNVPDRYGNTALICAVTSWLTEGTVEVVEALLKAGVNTEHRNCRQLTALAELCLGLTIEQRKKWRRHDDNSEQQALADCRRIRAHLIDLLLAHGANPWAKVGVEQKPIVQTVLENASLGDLEEDVLAVFHRLEAKGPVKDSH